MLKIDGSHLEGGGEVVRGAVALSAITGIPVNIVNIRENRPKKGLAAQHVAAVKAVAGVCGGVCEGLAPESRDLIFSPGDLVKRDLVVDVGTAGSIPLVLQAWLPPALHAGGTITVTGGTEVMKSPTIDYFDRVFAEVLRRHGAGISITVQSRGYYPRGGGRVTVSVTPSSIARLGIMDGPSRYRGICSCSSNLPDHVADRQAVAAQDRLLKETGEVYDIFIDRREGPGTGTSVTVWSGWKGGIALGRRGLPAEVVGRSAAGDLISELGHEGAADVHLADQVLIYLADYGGEVSTSSSSMHAATMCWLVREFGFDVRVRTNGCAVFSA